MISTGPSAERKVMDKFKWHWKKLSTCHITLWGSSSSRINRLVKITWALHFPSFLVLLAICRSCVHPEIFADQISKLLKLWSDYQGSTSIVVVVLVPIFKWPCTFPDGLWLENEARVDTSKAKPLTLIKIEATALREHWKQRSELDTGLLQISSVRCIFWDRTVLLQVGVLLAALSPSEFANR